MAPSPPPVVIPRTTATEFASRKFDYLVVGGGTAGLVVAARLSEDPTLTIGVLEAGSVGLGDPGIDVPGLYGTTLGSEYDWQFETVPQPGLAGRTVPWARGKVLGGSSALNFMTWNRPSREDFDAWEQLGNGGWGWDGLLPFFRKAEGFREPTDDGCKKENKLLYDRDALGKSGPLPISYSTEYSASHVLWHPTLNALGVGTNEAHLTGSNVGAWTTVVAVDPRSVKRSYSASAYYLPNATRPNLVVLTEALVKEVIISDHEGQWTATGVRFRHGDQEFVVRVDREVILSAGSVQSPQLLELSGIGNRDTLTRGGISVKVENPNVGENLQDHLMVFSIFEVDPSIAHPDDHKLDDKAIAAAQQLYAESKSGPLTLLANSLCYLPLSHVVSEDTHASFVSRLDSLTEYAGDEKTIRNQRFDRSARLGQIEFLFDLGNWSPSFKPPADGKKYGTCLQMLQYPFSRGSVHIPPAGAEGTPSTAEDKPLIDPKYYAGPHGQLDLDVMAHCALFADKIAKTKPLADIIRGRVFPPPEVVDVDEVRDWVVETTVTDWHPVGTCGMGGRRGIEGGVVDERLRVHGVNGLRVVDASIMPLQISAHLQATVYAIAEKGAAMILEDYRATW